MGSMMADDALPNMLVNKELAEPAIGSNHVRLQA